MKKLTKEQELMLLKIERGRAILACELEKGFIDSGDIARLFRHDISYGFKKARDYREKVLIHIFNNPYMLCDQDNLDIDIKKLLPQILKTRYDIELEELYALYEQCYISDDELLERKEMLKFCYYESSVDGEEIAKNGKVRKLGSMKSVK